MSSLQNLTPDEAQYRRTLIAEQHPDAKLALRITAEQREAGQLESINGSFARVASEITSAQIEAAKRAEVNTESRRSKLSVQLHEKNIHE